MARLIFKLLIIKYGLLSQIDIYTAKTVSSNTLSEKI